MKDQRELQTSVLPVDVHKIGRLVAIPNQHDLLDDLEIQLDSQGADAANLRSAAEQLKHSDIPVAFPTETVYGLGADATRSAAVRGIYKAKRRPADNPLIVHFASLRQLRDILRPGQDHGDSQVNGHVDEQLNGHISNGAPVDPIPEIYKPLITKFWPGPLTILLPNPPNSPLAPEVTAGSTTFGARMPRHVLALALIKLAGVPLAAPSANASTKPSPTAAEHVAYDLNGRIETIIDGGPCDIGVESTVVDGLCSPPVILRPGGISIEQLRSCPGWGHTQIGYKNAAENGSQPRAPGMKYRHYSPRALVILYEVARTAPTLHELCGYLGPSRRIGIITTKSWSIGSYPKSAFLQQPMEKAESDCRVVAASKPDFSGMLEALHSASDVGTALKRHKLHHENCQLQLFEIALGYDTANVARGIFSALRELDREDVDAIFVEGINDLEGNTAAAVMNRLRKAAETTVTR